MISNLPGVKASDAVDLRGTKCVADGMYAQQVYGGSAIWKAHTLLPGSDQGARFAPTAAMRRGGGVLQQCEPSGHSREWFHLCTDGHRSQHSSRRKQATGDQLGPYRVAGDAHARRVDA